jgi:hypothetical protein
MDLNAELANSVPAWRAAIAREQKVLSRLQARGPVRCALPGDATAEFTATVLGNAQKTYEHEMAPHARRIAIYGKALELAGLGLLPLFDAHDGEINEFRVKHHSMIQGAMEAGRYQRVGRRELDEVAMNVLETLEPA